MARWASLPPERVRRLQAKQANLGVARRLLETTKLDGQPWLERLKRPELSWVDLPEPFQKVDPEIASQLETEIKYEGYLRREQAHIARNRADEGRSIPAWINFDVVPGLKAEARAKLKKIQPRTFGQAGRISGINPTDVFILQIHAKRGQLASSSAPS